MVLRLGGKFLPESTEKNNKENDGKRSPDAEQTRTEEIEVLAIDALARADDHPSR